MFVSRCLLLNFAGVCVLIYKVGVECEVVALVIIIFLLERQERCCCCWMTCTAVNFVYTVFVFVSRCSLLNFAGVCVLIYKVGVECEVVAA